MRRLPTPQLDLIRARIAALRAQRLEPIEIIMSPETWDALKREYRAGSGGLMTGVVSARAVLGLRNRLAPGAVGTAIRYFGGVDLPPDQAVIDGFIDPPKSWPTAIDGARRAPRAR